MAEKNFVIGEAFGFGWSTVLKNIGFFIILFIILVLINLIPNKLANAVRPGSAILALIIALAGAVLQIITSIGTIKIALRFCDNEKGQFGDLFNYANLFFKYLFASILYGLIVLGGLILLVIPGIMWAIQFSFFPYFIVDKKTDTIASLRKSSVLTNGIKWELFFFGLLMILVNILGGICLLIGLVVTIPTTMLAYAWIYRKLLSQEPAV